MKNRQFRKEHWRCVPFVMAGVAMLVGGPAFPAWAQPPQHPTEAEQRIEKKMIVTADRVKEEVSQVTQNVTVISEKEIERSSADNVVDLLKRHGIQTFHEGSANYGNDSVMMRGGKSSMHGFDLAGDVLFLVDGRRVGSDNFAVLGLDNVQRVEIIRGPGAVQYGSGANSGVINVITKRGQASPEASVEAGMGSFGTERYKGFVSGRAGKLDMAAWGSYTSADDYTDGKGNKLNNTSLDYLTKFGFNAGWNFNEKNRLGVSFSGMEGHEMGMGPYSSSTYSDQYQNRDYYMAEILYEGATHDDSLSWMARYYFGETSYELSRLSQRAASRGQRENYSDNENKIQGGQAQLSYSADRFKLTGGVDALYYDMEQNQPYSPHTTQANANYTTSDYLNVGTFLIGKLYLLENRNLTLSAGARYDYFKVNLDSSYGPGTSSARDLDGDTTEDSFIPSFGIAYNPWDFLKLRANYSEAFRMPTPRQLGGLFAMGGRSIFVGNPDLKPEKSRTWDMGFDLDYRSVAASFTFFDTRYRDMIVALPAGSVPGSPNDRPYVNLDSSHIQGIEVTFSFDVGHYFALPFTLEPYVSLSHLITFEDNMHRDLTDMAEDSVSWGLVFEHPAWGVASSLDFTYFGKRISGYSDTGHKEYYPGGATVVDFSLSKELYEFENGGNLKLKFLIENLFDKYYATSTDDYMPGRAFYMGLRYEY